MQKIVILLALGVALAGCAGNNTTTTPTPATGSPTAPATMTPTATPTATPVAQPQAYHSVSFVAKEAAGEGGNTSYSFEGPASTQAGWNNVSLKNEGAEPHQLAFFKLHDGVTYAQVMQMMAGAAQGGEEQGGEEHARPFDAYGGVGVVSPMQTSVVTMELVEGAYFVACFIPGPDGQPHAFHGMTAAFNVTKGTGASSIEPDADVTVTAKDFTFTFSENVTAGRHTVEMVNAGPHLHEVIFVQMAEGKTSQDLAAYFAGPPQGPPPGNFVNGMAPHQANKPVFADITFTPGNWVLICFESDGSQGPHAFAQGMVLDFTVA